jgi:Type II secretion system (T2SS), protein G
VKRAVALLLLLAACAAFLSCAESKARRLAAQADALARQSKYEDAIGLLERLERDYPKTDAARGVRERIVLYRGFLEANQKQDRRRAKDDLIAIGRALVHYYEKKRRYPATLDELAGDQSIPEVDPWGRVYVYSPSVDRSSYRLECLGEDGVRGGEGNSVDIRIVNGNLVQDLPWEDR